MSSSINSKHRSILSFNFASFESNCLFDSLINLKLSCNSFSIIKVINLLRPVCEHFSQTGATISSFVNSRRFSVSAPQEIHSAMCLGWRFKKECVDNSFERRRTPFTPQGRIQFPLSLNHKPNFRLYRFQLPPLI